MLLREVDYARPGTVDEAISLLGTYDGARALAGGQTIVNVMKARAATPDVLIDLADLAELRTIGFSSDGLLEIGAMVTYAQLVASSEVDVARPILGEVAATIGDVQVRNRGTIGGNVCVSDPTNHFPPLLVAIGASFTIRGSGGERVVPADEFFIGVYMTAVAEGELLTKASVPPMPELLELYRLRWDLTEISLYVALFRAPHTDTADTRTAWNGLRHSLQALSALPS